MFMLPQTDVLKLNHTLKVSSDKIKAIELSTHSDWNCGGYNLQIQLIQGRKKCLTDKVKDFNPGKTLKWSLTKGNLGNCKDINIDFNKEMLFKMKTESDNEFCPENLYIELMYGLKLLSDKMVHWHDFYDNDVSHKIYVCESC